MPYDNYGSFFGPSQPVIARRILEESKSILETQHIHVRTPNSNTGMGLGFDDDDDISCIWQRKKMPLSSNEEKRDSVRCPPPKAVNELKMKVQKLRDTCDYSFLMSDDVEFPIPLKEFAPRNGPVPTSDARPAQVPLKGKAAPSISKTVKSIPNGHEGRKSVSTSRQMPTKVAHPKVASTSRPEQPSAGPKKLLGSNVGNGPGRPLGPKGPLPKISTTAVEKKKAALVSAKNSIPVASKAPLPKSQAISQKHYSEQKKDHRPVDKPNVISRHPVDKPKVMPKKSVPSSKPQLMGQIKSVADRHEMEIDAGVVDPRHLKMGSRKYYRYLGSLTTTPCNEGVICTIFIKVRTVSKEQVRLLRLAVQDDGRIDYNEFVEMIQKGNAAFGKKRLQDNSIGFAVQQMKPPKQMPARSMREDRPKKRPANRNSNEDMDDGEEAIRMIRNMFGYNPKKYADVDDDVSDMEANFDDILKEERGSAKIAREEDEREQRLIEEEERRMRMRKEAKKRKL